MKIQNKQDVIRWLERLKADHPLTTWIAKSVNDKNQMGEPVMVFTDEIIKDRYTGMIEYLKSEEVA